MTAPDPVTAATFLFAGNGVAELAQALADAGLLQQLHGWVTATGLSPGAVANQLASVVNGFLDLDLASVAVAGWRKHQELIDVAEGLEGTSASAIVPLGTEDISVVQKPKVELLLGSTTVAAIEFELAVKIAMVGIAGVVKGGSLVAFEGVSGEATVSFGAAGVTLAQRTAAFDPRLTIPLGSAGIRLVVTPRTGLPGWYQAPDHQGQQWWDGRRWTEHRLP
jgi:Protein of unknown function (DUF2510)